jgi:hypothetical protein
MIKRPHPRVSQQQQDLCHTSLSEQRHTPSLPLRRRTARRAPKSVPALALIALAQRPPVLETARHPTQLSETRSQEIKNNSKAPPPIISHAASLEKPSALVRTYAVPPAPTVLTISLTPRLCAGRKPALDTFLYRAAPR